MITEPGYEIFKGLQKPLEFMAIRGRFLVIAAAVAGGAIMSYFIAAFTLGQLAGLGLAVIVLAVGAATIFIKQKKGLHNKQLNREIVIYNNLFKS